MPPIRCGRPSRDGVESAGHGHASDRHRGLALRRPSASARLSPRVRRRCAAGRRDLSHGGATQGLRVRDRCRGLPPSRRHAPARRCRRCVLSLRHAGGGSPVGKGGHPLTACLYLKVVEGRAHGGRPIRPATVSARVHEITRLPGYRDRGFLRTDYEDVEDYGQLHVTFEDGTVADVFATELVLGGVHNWLEVFANNHRTTCRLNPVNLLDTYNPEAEQFRDVYLVEKIGTKEGWSHPAADEEWQQGFYAEIQDFVECCASGRRPQSDAEIGRASCRE